jgi:hypothetical protein
MSGTLRPAENACCGLRAAFRGDHTSSTVARPKAAGKRFGRLAAAPSSAGAGSRLESRLALLTVGSRAVTILAGVLFGVMNHASSTRFLVASLAVVAYGGLVSSQQVHTLLLRRLGLLTIVELVVAVGAIMATGGFKSPYILTPITGLLLAGYVWGRRAAVGTTVAGTIAAAAVIAIQSTDSADQRAASQVAVIFLLCGVLGAFTRNLVVELEAQRAAAIDQATQMATANELLVSLHALAQTLPASFDLGEVVESIRQRVRALFPYTALVVLVPDDAGEGWRAELAEGVRVPARLLEVDLPLPVRQAMTRGGPVVVSDRIADPTANGFAALCRSGLYTALRARGARRGRRDRARAERRVRTGRARPPRVVVERARALARQRALVRPAAHPRRRGGTGSYRP